MESYHGNSKLAASYLFAGLQRKREKEGETKGCLSFTLFAMSRKYQNHEGPDPIKVCVSRPWYLIPLCHKAPLLLKNLLSKQESHCGPGWHFPPLALRRTFVGYSDSMPHTPSSCWKHSLKQQMCITPRLKVVPQQKLLFYSCLSNICQKRQHPDVAGNCWRHYRMMAYCWFRSVEFCY